jgi:hypothetical protein
MRTALLLWAAAAALCLAHAAGNDRLISLKHAVRNPNTAGEGASKAFLSRRAELRGSAAAGIVPRADGCETRELAAEGSADGTLATGDCTVRDIVPTATVPAAIRPNSADVYRITVPRKTVLRVEMTSTQVDSYLYLLRGPSGAILARNDNGLGERNAVISIQLDPGAYLLVATSAASGNGDYKLSSKLDAIRQCNDQTLQLDSEADGTLGDPDCRFVDLQLNATNPAHLDRYRVEITKRSVLVVSMNSPDADALLTLTTSGGTAITTDDNSGPGNNALVTASVEPGTYNIIATTTGVGTGSYKLLAKSEDQRACSAATLTTDAPSRGDLSSADCRGLDIFLPSTDTISLDVFEFELTSPKIVSIRMRSLAFDTYLTLLAPTGRALLHNDDFEDASTDSQIVLSLPVGKYKVLASAFEASIGDYEISLSTENLRECTVDNIALPGSRNAALTPEGCRFLDFLIPSSDRDSIQPYLLKVEKRSVIGLEAKSAAFDGALLLLDGRLRVITADDDSGGNLNPKIEVLLNPGEYTLLVTSLDGQTGAYDLTTTVREPRTCVSETVGTDATVVGTLADSDCRLGDFVPGLVDDSPADQYTLTLTETRKVTLDVGSSEFVAAALPLTENYEIVEKAVLSVNTDRGVTTFTAGPGTYRIAVTTFTGTGTYVLKTSTQEP